MLAPFTRKATLAWLALINGMCLGLSGQEAAPPPEAPKSYRFDYPEADRFCPPIRSTFFEVTRRYIVVRGKKVRQKPNGGYGLPIVDKVGDKRLIHVGADLGWHQIGEPVFAVANGIVRLSSGPAFDPLASTKPKAKSGRKTDESKKARSGKRSQNDLAWGNLVVVEHRLPNGGDYFTTVYGHLNTTRFVRAGDTVKAGQPLGTIGRQHLMINGGYKPHLHFGVRSGRLVGEGTPLIQIMIAGKPVRILIKAINEEHVELTLSPAGSKFPFDSFELTINGTSFQLVKKEGRLTMPRSALWHAPTLATEIVGYDLNTEQWNDPVAFLKEHQAHTQAAPFRPLDKEVR